MRRMKQTKILSAAILLTILSYSPLSLASPIQCGRLYTRVSLPQSSVEIEISGQVVEALMTTETGTLRPIAQSLGHKAIPPEILARLKRDFPLADPLDVSWAHLSTKEKLHFISYSAKARGQSFIEDRQVHGLKYRQTVSLEFKRPSRFLGRDYPAGTYTFSSRDLFADTKIEFSGERGTWGETADFEIHLRRADGADENLVSARTLQLALTGIPENVHQHVVAPIDVKAAATNPFYYSFRMVEFFRRINLYAQTLRIKQGFPLNTLSVSPSGDSMTTFERLDLWNTSRFLNGLGLALNDAGFASKKTIPTLNPKDVLNNSNKVDPSLALKSGLIGIRAGQIYDGKDLLWGLEFRDLSPKLDQQQLKSFLRTTQERMIRGNFGIDDQVLLPFFEKHRPAGVTFEEALYPASLDALPVNEYARTFNIPELANYRASTTDTTAVKLLFHDWSDDPLLRAYPEYSKKFVTAQRQALIMIARGYNDRETMMWFVKKSGLQHLLELSLGLTSR